MCGIAGIWLRDAGTETAIRAMVDALSHRGPDDRGLIIADTEGILQVLPHSAAPENTRSRMGTLALAEQSHPVNGPVQLALGQTRLSILDLSPAGCQPMRDPISGNWIVYNGEVYNFRQIRRMLETHGAHFRSEGDTEVLLHAYAQWGPDCVRHFRGMFALAIWDEKARHLFLARDRLGVKPLYYFHDARRFLFASELRALLASSQVPREVSSAGLATYLAYGAVTEPETLITGVKTIPAGHTALFDGETLAMTRYWGLDGFGWEQGTPPRPKDAQEAVEAVRTWLQEAVQLRLVSDVPLGALLSGGIDSSAVVALMAQAAPGRVRTVSIGFEEEAFDESTHSELVARQNHTDHHAMVLTAREFLQDVEQALSALDQPSIDGMNTWFVSRAARQAGLTVALSGLGADELFAGYSTFRTTPRLERIRQLAASLPPVARKAVLPVAAGLLPRRQSLSIRKRVTDLLALAPEIQHAGLMQRALFSPSQVGGLLGEPRLEAVLPAFEIERDLLIRGISPVRQLSVIECGQYLRNMLLRDTDTMSMAHALEVRGPFLDHRLVEQVLGLEDRWKLDRAMSKPLLVRAMGARLPRSVVQRRKQGFTFPFDVWLQARLGRRVEEALCSGRSVLTEWLDPAALAQVWREFERGRLNWSRPWSLYVLHHWLDEHLRRPGLRHGPAASRQRREGPGRPPGQSGAIAADGGERGEAPLTAERWATHAHHPMGGPELSTPQRPP